MAYGCRVLRDSVSPDNVRLITLEVTYPRLIHSEVMTHRVFSRNSASSRAIPVEKMLKRVQEDPFVPIHWGKNQKGMSAEVELTKEEQREAELEWLLARDHAVTRAQVLLNIGVHKQVTNRLLEPFLWHTVIVTSTEWPNWDGLRVNKAAQPEIERIARLMLAARQASSPSPVNYGDWHLPLVEPAEAFDLQVVFGMTVQDVVKVSVGRCARVSYLTHDGKRDPRADVELAERLKASGHMSPWEHVARPMTREDAEGYLRVPGVVGIDPLDIDLRQVPCGNFHGWVQARKLIPNEGVFVSR